MCKHFLFYLIALTFLLLSLSFAFSQTCYMDVNLADGSKCTYAIDDISKIEFSHVTSLKDAQKMKRVIKSLKLLQNYPNPFNPSTSIEYEIPKAGVVKITIYDINGRLIKTIIRQHQAGGSYQVQWNSQNEHNVKLASGIYVYRIKFGDSIISKKMILVK